MTAQYPGASAHSIGSIVGSEQWALDLWVHPDEINATETVYEYGVFIHTGGAWQRGHMGFILNQNVAIPITLPNGTAMTVTFPGLVAALGAAGAVAAYIPSFNAWLQTRYGSGGGTPPSSDPAADFLAALDTYTLGSDHISIVSK